MYFWLQLGRRWACGLTAGAARRWGDRLGRFFWRVLPRKRKDIAVENILRAELAASPEQARAIAKTSAVRLGRIALDMLRFPLYTEGRILEQMHFTGTEELDDLYQSGGGCIIAASHTDNWEMLGGALASKYPGKIVAVGFKQSNEGFDRFIRESRAMLGEEVLYPKNMREIVRLLENGKWICLLYDQDGGGKGMLAQLFRTLALSVTGPAVFSYARKVPIVPVHVYTRDEGFDVVVQKALWTRQDLKKAVAVREMTDTLNAILAERVSERPADWFWIHNRWKWTKRIYGDPHDLWRKEQAQRAKEDEA